MIQNQSNRPRAGRNVDECLLHQKPEPNLKPDSLSRTKSASDQSSLHRHGESKSSGIPSSNPDNAGKF